jgi:sugar lactone lactonase YvrE
MNLKHAVVVGIAALGLAACEGDLGPQGPEGPQGEQGEQGPVGPAAPDERQVLQLPGNNFYPESITAGTDGSLYVGSFTTGQVVRFAPGAVRHTPFISSGLRNVAGVLADPARGLLWVCDFDVSFATPGRVKSFALASGAPQGTYEMPSGQCNDMVLDGQGHLYVTDPVVSRIFRLPSGGTALAIWSEAAVYQGPQGQFTVDGLTWDGQGALFVNKFNTGELFRVRILENGAAAAPEAITVTPALSSPDGMRQLDANTLLVVEGAGRLTRVAISGATATGTVLSNRLDGPTGVALVGQSAWVSEGQLSALFGDPNPADVPFTVRRVELP